MLKMSKPMIDFLVGLMDEKNNPRPNNVHEDEDIEWIGLEFVPVKDKDKIRLYAYGEIDDPCGSPIEFDKLVGTFIKGRNGYIFKPKN